MLGCFERCTKNGWLVERWWRRIRIKVGAAEKDVHILLSMLDLSNFVELRDAAAVLMMYQGGLRLATVGNNVGGEYEKKR